MISEDLLRFVLSRFLLVVMVLCMVFNLDLVFGLWSFLFVYRFIICDNEDGDEKLRFFRDEKLLFFVFGLVS